MMIASPQAIAAHRRNLGRLVAAGQDLARTAEKTQEMALASVQTIGYRTAMMMQAVGDPVAMTNPEFTLMGQEKVEAAIQSHHAMMDSCRAMFEGWSAWVMGQAGTTAKAMTELATCRTPADVVRIQQNFVQCSFVNATNAATKLTEAVIRMTDAGLVPIHKVAYANAERLAKEHA
ncbi:phasin family protein [Skermanella pratensis]|uniref:phasin family protein n=1 Tax=Skermanella pratensis TaxID=2233999 RepID=UPI00130102E9|nr:phasin family protein [Skermanella pratensis]